MRNLFLMAHDRFGAAFLLVGFPAVTVNIVNMMGRAQRKKGRLPPSFYLEQRAQLAAQGKTPPKAADNTKKGLASILKKWEGYFIFHRSICTLYLTDSDRLQYVVRRIVRPPRPRIPANVHLSVTAILTVASVSEQVVHRGMRRRNGAKWGI